MGTCLGAQVRLGCQQQHALVAADVLLHLPSLHESSAVAFHDGLREQQLPLAGHQLHATPGDQCRDA